MRAGGGGGGGLGNGREEKRKRTREKEAGKRRGGERGRRKNENRVMSLMEGRREGKHIERKEKKEGKERGKVETEIKGAGLTRRQDGRKKNEKGTEGGRLRGKQGTIEPDTDVLIKQMSNRQPHTQRRKLTCTNKNTQSSAGS